MCWCTPSIRTPNCGRIECVPPTGAGAFPVDPKSPQIKPPTSSAFELLKRAIHEDPGYAWSWHCNVAMPILDSDVGLTHYGANEAAARVMQHIFGIDVRSFQEWKFGVWRPLETRTAKPCESNCPKCGSASVKGHWRPELGVTTPEQITVTCNFCDHVWTVAPIAPATGFAQNGEG